ncbi:MAG: 50S ribosomal protein L32 [Candidatus Levybacteria bacterium RIFCSPHIGHO2_01_FULL_40_10]|nr:MAG: 50S ribosomal protein L32 [Candidatus Levybacteria bacterium RIFCSPHIGHO2_01_FULL_40_10]
MPHEPKKRLSRARQGKRRAAISLSETTITVCKNCGSAVAPHVICYACGYYKGKKVA